MHSLMVSEPRKTGNDFEHPRLADPGQGQLKKFSPKFLIDIFAKICQKDWKDACISGDWVTFRETPG